jgi:hypothetical protein
MRRKQTCVGYKVKNSQATFMLNLSKFRLS